MTPDEIARKLMYDMSSCGGEMCEGAACVCRDAIASAIASERRAREEVERELRGAREAYEIRKQNHIKAERERDEARAALAAADAQGWQSMDTAPKDGTAILLYSSKAMRHETTWVGFWHHPYNGDPPRWVDVFCEALNGHPTAWRVLPSPPEPPK